MSHDQQRFGASATSSGLTLGGWLAWARRSRTSPAARSMASERVGEEVGRLPASLMAQIDDALCVHLVL